MRSWCIRRARATRLHRYQALRSRHLTLRAKRTTPVVAVAITDPPNTPVVAASVPAAPAVWRSSIAKMFYDVAVTSPFDPDEEWADTKIPEPSSAEVESVVKLFLAKWEKHIANPNAPPFKFEVIKIGVRIELGRVMNMYFPAGLKRVSAASLASGEPECSVVRQATILSVEFSPAWRKKGLLHRVVHAMLNSSVAKLEGVQISAIRNWSWLERMTCEALRTDALWHFTSLPDPFSDGEHRDSFVRVKDIARDADLSTFRFYSDSK